MMTVGVEVSSVKPGVCIVLIQSLKLAQVNSRVVLPKPVPICHFATPRGINQLKWRTEGELMRENMDIMLT